jgi:hypothetical protein
VKCSLNIPNHQFAKRGSPGTVGVTAIVYIFTTLIKEMKHKKDKQKVQINNKPHLVHNMERCCQNYAIRTCCHPFFPVPTFCVQK